MDKYQVSSFLHPFSIEKQSVSEGVLPMKDTRWVIVHGSPHRLRSQIHSSTSICQNIHIDSYFCLARNTGRTSAGVKWDRLTLHKTIPPSCKNKEGSFYLTVPPPGRGTKNANLDWKTNTNSKHTFRALKTFSWRVFFVNWTINSFLRISIQQMYLNSQSSMYNFINQQHFNGLTECLIYNPCWITVISADTIFNKWCIGYSTISIIKF